MKQIQQPHHLHSVFSVSYSSSSKSGERIPVSASVSHHFPHQYQSKAAIQKKHHSRITHSASSRSNVYAQRMHISTRRTHPERRRSRNYTRTLDIILEDETRHNDRATGTLCPTDANSRAPCPNNANTDVIATDFWHSMRSMKKSATCVSLDSLVANEEDNNNDGTFRGSTTTSSNDENTYPSSVITDYQHGEDYDNFLEDWE